MASKLTELHKLYQLHAQRGEGGEGHAPQLQGGDLVAQVPYF